MKEKNFKFKESFYKAMLGLNEKQIGRLVKGICEYAYEGKEFTAKDAASVSAYTLIKTATDEDRQQEEETVEGGLIGMTKDTADGQVRVVAQLNDKNCSLKEALTAAFVALNTRM